jgi:ADP-heptose:LPS heptosyltransferase
VLLVRLDGIGDALACAPLVEALSDAGHELGAVLSLRNRDVFAARTFAHVHAVERIPWPRHGMTRASRDRALGEARRAHYDVALIASEEPDAYTFALDARIKRRIGFVNGWEKPFKTLSIRPMLTHALVRPASAALAIEHEVETLFRLGRGLHGEGVPTRDPERLRPLILDAEPQHHNRVAIQLNAKFVEKGIDIAAFAAIARELERHGLLTLGTSDDDEFGTAFAARSGTAFAPTATLLEWKALLGGARAIVTVDSGAAHVAGMLGIPSVVLFAPGAAVEVDMMRWRPWAAPSRTIVVDDVTQLPERVAAALAELFAGAKAPA